MANGDLGTKTRRLNTWKEIAAYLGRDVRTVIRWEKDRGLPVRRTTEGTARPTVYVDAEELDRWLLGHPEDGSPEPSPVKPVVRGRSPWRKWAAMVNVAGFVIALGALAATLWQRHIIAKSTRHLQFARSDYPANAPMSVVTADFDHDGNLDLVFTNAASDTVDIVFGDGTGLFGRRVSIAEGAEPERLATADFNGDGHMDLVVTNLKSGDLAVLLGDGKGNFRESFRWDSQGRSRWVSAKDMNGDGLPDLAVACSRAHKLAVLLGRGDGTFIPAGTYDTDGENSAVIAGQFDNDKVLDLMIADYRQAGANTVSLYNGRGDGTFRARRPFRTGFGPLAIAAADFNHDGKMDVATANFHEGLSVLLGTGNGFTDPHNLEAGNATGFVATADFDGDGHLDLIAVGEHSNSAHILYGDGKGNFPSQQQWTTGTYPDSIALGDFDHDGRPDFAIGNVFGNSVSVFLNRTPR